MSRCWVHKNGRSFSVYNLGWLLRNWKEVLSFEILPPTGNRRGCYAMTDDCSIIANLEHPGSESGSRGNFYFTDFASRALLEDWLDRPVFRGLRVKIESGELREIGGPMFGKKHQEAGRSIEKEYCK